MRARFLLPPLSLLLVALWTSSVSAGDGDATFASCQLALKPVHFGKAPVGTEDLAGNCRSLLRIKSLYLCLRVYGPGRGWLGDLASYNETCQDSFGIPLPPFTVVAGYSDRDVRDLTRLGVEERSGVTIWNEVVLVSEKLYHAADETLGAFSYVYRLHYIYGAAVVAFWFVVIIIGTGSRWFLGTGATLPARVAPEDHSTSRSRRVGTFLKRHVTIPATFGYRCSQDLGFCTIPPRIESLTILAFVAMNIFFCIHGYRLTTYNLYFPGISKQLWRYVSDRTGIVSFANFPIIWLFGMRNNLLMWLTGWDFGTFNNFHRWVARVATVQAVVHSVGYTVLVFKDGGWTYFCQWWTWWFWNAGEMATIFMCLILGVSVIWMRRKHYETFLITHILLSILMLVTMWGHVSIFPGQFNTLVWISASIWIMDRIFRVSRIMAFNPLFWNTRAAATYDPDSNIVRLTVPHSRSLYQPKPGTFYYLHVLNSAQFWESHPFTMAYATNKRPCPEPVAEETPLMQDEDDIKCGQDFDSSSWSMTFLIRPYDGFTRRLRDAAATSPTVPASLRVLVEGPYGHTHRLDQFSNVMFIIGGSGIAVALSYLENLTRSTTTQSVVIVWAVRERRFAKDVLEQDLGKFMKSEKVSVKICLTHQEETSNEVLAGFPKISVVKYDRPDIRQEVEAVVRDAACGNLAVVSCGPATMADDARKAVVDLLRDDGPRLEYFEESFRW